jgi:hypothetical protein
MTMLIFHSFPSLEAAENFAADTRKHRLRAFVCKDQKEAEEIEASPSALTGPIVLVERPGEEADPPEEVLIGEDEELTSIIVEEAEGFGGVFAEEEEEEEEEEE